MRYFRFAFYLSIVCIVVAGCSSARETLGLNKKSPDEFAVVKRAPLAIPPGYELRPPQPGAPRPQEQSTTEEAKQVVFGTKANTKAAQPSSGEDVLLQQAGSDIAQENIRNTVDSEIGEYDSSRLPVAKRLLNIGSDEAPASLVDAKAEMERLRQNAAEGKPVTEGETPTIDD